MEKLCEYRTDTNTDNFDKDFFKNKARKRGENTHLDFKRYPYKFVDDENKSKAERKRDFVKDMIAFANVAWCTKRPCYILFGVPEGGDNIPEEKKGEIFWDISNYNTEGKTNHWWRDTTKKIRTYQKDKIEERYRDILKTWVGPQIPDFSLEHGCIDGKFVSYIKINQIQSSSRPYYLKKSFEQTEDRVNDVFIRKGSSTDKLLEDEANRLRQIGPDVEYLKEKEWRKLIIAHKINDFFKFKEMTPYFEAKLVSAPEQTVISAVLASIEEGNKVNLLVGPAGIGKTVIVHRLAYELAERHMGEKGILFIDYLGDEVVPDKKIPIFLSLREGFDNIKGFEARLIKKIYENFSDNPHKRQKYKEFESFYEIPKTKWVLLLDGLDELRCDSDFVFSLSTWIKDLPDNVQVIVSSRPNVIFSQTQIAYEEFQVRPLDKEEIKKLLFATLSQELKEFDKEGEYRKTKSRIKQLFKKSPELYNVVSRQRTLQSLIEFAVNYNVPLPRQDQETEKEITKKNIKGDKNLSITAKSLQISVTKENKKVDSGKKYKKKLRRRFKRRKYKDIYSRKIHENYESKRKYRFRKDRYSKTDKENNWSDSLKNLALCLEFIIDDLSEKEKKRKGSKRDAEDLKNHAFEYISEVAFRLPWNIFAFRFWDWAKKVGFVDKLYCTKIINWNHDLGIIRKRKFKADFDIPILRYYLAAAFAYYKRYTEDELVKNIPDCQTLGMENSPIDFLNMLREANGLEKISLNFEKELKYG